MSLNAQSTFITVADISPGELTPAQNDKYQRILNQATVASVTFVQIANLAETQQNGWLTLKMPDKDCTAEVKAKYVASKESGDFYWHDEIIKEDGEAEEDCQCYDGVVNLMKNNGELIGTISLDEDIYEIQSLGEGVTVLVKKDLSELGLSCGNEGAEDENGGEQGSTPRNEGNCPVRVLALFTPNGAEAVANIQNTIALSIAQTNQALRNSQVSECDLELILADVRAIQFNESNIIADDVEALIVNDSVQVQRNAADADIVAVYTDGDYGIALGRAGTLTLEDENALCVIEATAATTNFVAAHEIAHLFACRHEPNADSTGPFEHAHEFRTGCWPFRKERNTIMFSVASDRAIQHYSNPNVKYKKKATGVTNERENWRQLRNNACTVANFRDDDVIPRLNANIFGQGYNCPCHGVGLEAQVTGGAPGLYQFEWRTSTDGFNWSDIQSTMSSFSIALPCEIGEGVYVRLTVRSADGQVDDTFRFIEAAETWPGQQGICPRHSNNGDQKERPKDVLLFPNPVADMVQLQLKDGDAMPTSVDLVDIWGRILPIQAELDLNSRTIKIPVEHLHEGLYFLRYGVDKALKFIKSSN